MQRSHTNMNNHQNPSFHPLSNFVKASFSTTTRADLNKITHWAKSVILLTIPIDAKVSKCL